MTGDIMQNTKKYYTRLVSYERDYHRLLLNFLQAFFFGGLLCLFGQVILEIFESFTTAENASLYLSIFMISLSGILSAIGIYDDIGQIAKCGVAIPITGFANACVSAAMDYKKEGLVLGIGSNCLKLAGSVIVLGTVSALLVSAVRYFFEVVL